jgi:hypothetical protein
MGSDGIGVDTLRSMSAAQAFSGGSRLQKQASLFRGLGYRSRASL